MSYHEIIVNRITALCRERGFSINQLAMMSNIGQSTLDNIIHGNSKNPTIQTLHKIALAFHMTVAEFLDYPELNHYSLIIVRCGALCGSETYRSIIYFRQA